MFQFDYDRVGHARDGCRLIPCFSGEPVDIGAFDWKGKTYSNATAELINADSVRITATPYGQELTLTWTQLNASVQFKLKPEREKLRAEAERESRRRTTIKELTATGVERVVGRVISVDANGCIVIGEREPPPVVDSMQAIGGGGGVYVPPPSKNSGLPRAVGTFFVRGLTGMADGEPVDIRAKRTSDVFRYVTARGAAATVRVFELIPSP